MKIYISHSAQDSDVAKRLAHELEGSGHEAWVAETGILPGDNWGQTLGQALADSEAMVVLLTPEALSSRWVRHEITYALGNERYEGRLLPVLIGPDDKLDPDTVPWALRSVAWLSLEAGQEAAAAKRISEALSPAFA